MMMVINDEAEESFGTCKTEKILKMVKKEIFKQGDVFELINSKTGPVKCKEAIRKGSLN